MSEHNNNGSALAIAQPIAIEVLAERTGYERDKIDLVKRTVARGTSDDELELFLNFCQASKLDPLSRQVYAIKRWDAKAQREVMSIQVGIDGFRSIAESSGEYDGQEGPQWCGADGEWRDVWTARELPVACRVGVYRKGQSRPVWGIVTYAEFCQRGKDGTPSGMWRTMPIHMLAVRAESHALRKALPRALGKLELAETTMSVSEIQEITETHLPPPGQRPDPRMREVAYSEDEDDDGQPLASEAEYAEVEDEAPDLDGILDDWCRAYAEAATKDEVNAISASVREVTDRLAVDQQRRVSDALKAAKQRLAASAEAH